MTFTEACSMYLSASRTRGRLKPSTLQAYRKDLAAAASVLPTALEQVTAANLTTYLVADVAPTTAARRLAALRGLFGWALRERHIASDPTLALEAPRRPRRLPRPIRADADRLAVERAITTAGATISTSSSTHSNAWRSWRRTWAEQAPSPASW